MKIAASDKISAQTGCMPLAWPGNCVLDSNGFGVPLLLFGVARFLCWKQCMHAVGLHRRQVRQIFVTQFNRGAIVEKFVAKFVERIAKQFTE